jgi:hypothetical protein
MNEKDVEGSIYDLIYYPCTCLEELNKTIKNGHYAYCNK